MSDFIQKIMRDQEFLDKKQKARSPAMKEQKLYYAGIGSRKTPDYILDLMEAVARKLRKDRMILRSGHAPRADQAFERGAGADAQIFLPWPSFEQDVQIDPKAFVLVEPNLHAADIAANFHPVWDSLSRGARLLHARNAHQILGPEPSARPTPVEFVLCWTPEGKPSGGTGQAIRIAEDRGIPIWNLANADAYDMAFEWAWSE